MSTAMLNIFIRTIQRRITNGETLEEIIESYPKLSKEDKEQIREAFTNN